MNVLFVVVCAFPLGDATSVRAINLVRLLALAGHQVHVIADVNGEEVSDLPCSYECISDCGSTRKERKSNARKSIRRIKQYVDSHAVDFILMNARYDRFNSIADLCHRKRIPLVIESCEWYNCESFKLKRADFRYYLNQKMLLHDFKKANGFISISRLLDEHNRSFGVPSIRIPTIIDVKNTCYRTTVYKNAKVCIVYTGNPRSSKEYLGPMISLLANDELLRSRIVFHIYGANRQQVLRNKGVLKKELDHAGKSVVIHGKIPQAEIQEVLINADYQLFLRPYRKSSNAGFPTKLGESMAVGTPVITNNTGDISLYLEDGKNGFLVAGNSKEALAESLLKVISLSEYAYAEMRKNARKTAENCFDYCQYVGEIDKLL